MTPMPPARAMAMAMGASVTRSMAADTTGMARVMSAANRALVLTSLGSTSLYPGTITTSSNVSDSKAPNNFSLRCWLANAEWAALVDAPVALNVVTSMRDMFTNPPGVIQDCWIDD